jgi:hypothetical protein
MSGGVSCLSSGNGTCWMMSPKLPTFWTQIEISTLQHDLELITPLRILTKSLFSAPQDMHYPLPETYLLIPTSQGSGFDTQQLRRWFGLSTAYGFQRANTTALRAERIAKQILFCRDTLYTLNRSYKFTMTRNVTSDNISYPTDGTVHFMSDKYAADIDYRTQSCLNELYALRDYLLYFLFEDMYSQKGISIRGGLMLLEQDDKFGLATMLSPMFAETSPMGLIALMSPYRNAFFHFMGTKNNPFGQAYCFREASSVFGDIPYLIYPLYDDINRLRSIERGASLDEGTSEQSKDEAKRFMQLANYTDALEFCYDSFISLLALSSAIEKQVKLASKNVELTDSDILEATFRHSDGTVAHFVKGEDGKLVEK